MAGSYVDFVESLIYGGALAPNHRDWLTAHPSPTGVEWLSHSLDAMLPALKGWLATEGLPPLTPWNGVRRAPWDPGQDLPLGSDLDGSFTGVTSLSLLGAALRDRYAQVALVASELNGKLKAPFSYRYWAYLQWAWEMRERFLGHPVFPTGWLFDRDGTLLSAAPFCDAFNDLHRNWHLGSTASPSATPGFLTTAGQRSTRGILGGGLASEEFLRFHREHSEIFHRWLARTGQPPLPPIDMGWPGGWPPVGAPSTAPPPWAEKESDVVAGSPLALLATKNDVGDIEFGYHVAGHGQNTDIGPLAHNNYVPRFHSWHGWIDAQWWWREPRFASSVSTTGERTRIFRAVLQDGSDFPAPATAISIVRDPLAVADSIDPPNAVGGLDLATGAGSLKLKLYVRDPFGRTLRMRLRAEVLDGAGAVAFTTTVLRTIGAAGDHPLDAEFTEDLALPGAFLSDDPARANPAVGFVNGRIRIVGNLWVPNPGDPDNPAASPDPGFVHEDATSVDLVREKLAPEGLVVQNLSSYSEDQVTSAMSGGFAQFDDSFYLLVQDRTTPSVPAPVWPALVADEVKGLLLGPQAASGLFDDLAHAPEVVLWREAGMDMPFTGVTVELLGPPAKEDPALPPSAPQRYTYRYAIRFAAGHDAFAGLPLGGSRTARLRTTVRDRAGNAATTITPVKLFTAENPFMNDGPVSWLSVDTRSFTVLEGQSRFGETLVAGQPRDYLAAILGRLNAGTTGGDTFEGLATEGPGAALEYAAELTDHSTGATTKIYNFALAKVHLQGAAGADTVRAFFRLFRYTAPSLLWNDHAGYRAHSAGATVVPLPGYESETVGAALISIPFFAAARKNAALDDLTTQDDPLNVHTFPPGPTTERVWYFGAWLDVNDPAARLAQAYPSGAPDGPFPAPSLQSLRTLMRDFHQCMVAEIRYDLDPTEALAAPATSDNLAQRNLVILESDNPGDAWTRTVEHSFEIDLARPKRGQEDPQHGLARHLPDHDGGMDHPHDDPPQDGEHGHRQGEPCECGSDELDTDSCCASCGCSGESEPLGALPPGALVSTFRFERLVHDEAMSLAMQSSEHAHLMHDHHRAVEILGAAAAANVRKAFPIVFHPTRWTETAALVDELMIRWNDLPAGSTARLFLPDVAAEQIASLRNARHAPATVRPLGGGELHLDPVPHGVTYLPIPPVRAGRLAGVLRIELPAGVRAGQRFVVDVLQLRAGSTVANGGFRVEIRVGKAPAIQGAVARGVELLHERLSLLPRDDRWLPILTRRLETERRRARGLAESANVPWQDPTVWTDDSGQVHPVAGPKIRVVLEKIRILDDRDPWWKGAGEIDFDVLVRTEDNGGIERRTRLPRSGHHELRDGEMLKIERTIFEGHAERHLAIRINAMERDLFDPDDALGSYVRLFSCDAESWLGAYGPRDERIDPENLRYWQVWYRIEKV